MDVTTYLRSSCSSSSLPRRGGRWLSDVDDGNTPLSSGADSTGTFVGPWGSVEELARGEYVFGSLSKEICLPEYYDKFTAYDKWITRYWETSSCCQQLQHIGSF